MPIATLVLGIVSLIFSVFAFFPCLFWLDFFNAVMGIIAIIFYIVSRNNYSYSDSEINFLKAGFITSIISLSLIIFRIIFISSGIVFLKSLINKH